jgi:hypothetical protein
VVIFGQSSQLLEKKLPNLIQFVENSKNGIIKVADCTDAFAVLRGTIKHIEIDLFGISFAVKQKLLIAEKNDTLRTKLKEVRHSVFSQDTNSISGAPQDIDGMAMTCPPMPNGRSSEAMTELARNRMQDEVIRPAM